MMHAPRGTGDATFFFLVIAGSLLGIWHALPLVTVIADEMYYVGGVFRALEALSPFPLPGDVPYGTITFFLNYLLQLPLIAGLLVSTGFDIGALKELLIVHPEVAYIVPRLAGALCAIGFGIFFNRFLRQQGVGRLGRMSALSALFCTVLPAVIFHTGKMWVLSFALVAVSLLYAYRAVGRFKSGGALAGSLYVSVIAAFLATANVLFAGLSLAVIPFLAYVLRRNWAHLWTLGKAVLAGVALFGLFLAVNFHNVTSLVALVLNQYDVPAEAVDAGIGLSLALHSYQLVAAFPLVLLLMLAAIGARALKHKTLFLLSGAYALVYFAFVAFSATWYTDASLYWRYMFPFGFFFACMLASFSYEGYLKKLLVFFLVLQACVYLYLLYLLCVPTTQNLAREYLIDAYGSKAVLIYDGGQATELPLNAISAAALKEEFCGSKCQYLKEHPAASGFAPFVLSDQSVIPESLPSTVVVVGPRLSLACAGNPAATFQSGARDEQFVAIEHNLGNYLLPDFWRLGRLGQNLYIYELTSACFAEFRAR